VDTELEFHKMQGAGNDFVLLDLRKKNVEVDSGLASKLADRRLGIGFDQMLLLLPPRSEAALARYEIRNTDGSPAGQCGNGARCIALYLALQGEVGDEVFTLDSPSGPVSFRRCPDGEFEVDMGQPAFEPDLVPIRITPRERGYRLESPWGPLEFGAASMGNPHAVLEVGDVDSAPLETLGPFLSTHEVFPEGCNTGFVQVMDRGRIKLRVHERGVGETLACGSGACAAVAVLRRAGRVEDTVDVFLPGGHLVVKWPGTGSGVLMKGPAEYVFRGIVTHG